jgi:hypothetical protein
MKKLIGRGIFPSATIFPAKIHKQLGGYTETSVHFDFDFWVMASLYFDSIQVNIPLVFFREWEGSHTKKNAFNPMPNYVASTFLTKKLLSSPLLNYKDKLNLKFRLLKNVFLSTFVLFKRLIITPRFIIVLDYFDFIAKSMKILLNCLH